MCKANSPPPKYAENSVNPVSGLLFAWDCSLDCKYKCQHLVTTEMRQRGEDVVQFHGKWPFVRVLGITELFLTLFSFGNFYVNYISFKKLRHYMRIKTNHINQSVVFFQFMLLALVNLIGWACSTIFHIRDTFITETLDYLGAGAIVIANFNAVFVRYFDLHLVENRIRRQWFQCGMLCLLLFHYMCLYISWDHDYNMKFNVFIGLLAAGLWILHSTRVHRLYSSGTTRKDLIYLAPYEKKITDKLRYLGIKSSTYIGLIPVVLNLYLIVSVSLEFIDFVPWFLLIDAHSLWHACTILPPIIWHDWNIWELELASQDFRLP